MAKTKAVKKAKSTAQKIDEAILKQHEHTKTVVSGMIAEVEYTMHESLDEFIEDNICIHELDENMKVFKAQIRALRDVVEYAIY